MDDASRERVEELEVGRDVYGEEVGGKRRRDNYMQIDSDRNRLKYGLSKTNLQLEPNFQF